MDDPSDLPHSSANMDLRSDVIFNGHESPNQDVDASTNPASPLNFTLDDEDYVVLQSAKIFIREGDHHDISDKERLPYRLVENLGYGASAIVEKVEDVNTKSVYARKIFRNASSRNPEDSKLKFNNEIQIMRRLAPHHHIIRVFATYVFQRELALILDPVADGGDLASFLQDFRDSKDAGVEDPKKTETLMSAFGCLANGLAFIHRQTIRHKDIKPQNILIHKGSVVFTDFGISRDFSQAGHSTTTGNPQAFTRRYCAPEVAEWDSRNSKSDVFSLGCVFLEIISALGISRMPDYVFNDCYYQYTEDILLYLNSNLSEPSRVTSRMLRKNPNERISAQDVVSQLLISELYFCTTCKEFLHKVETSNPKSAELIHSGEPFLLDITNAAQGLLNLLPNPISEQQSISIPIINSLTGVAENFEDNSMNQGLQKCPHCSEIPKCPRDYRKHILGHEKPYKCDVRGCRRGPKGFTTINDLRRHRKSVHRIRSEVKSCMCTSEVKSCICTSEHCPPIFTEIFVKM